ncbi:MULTISPECIES: phosphosulfolactate synthase [unclassified Saccharicrinis]|uniref:phosphosulfolactate synthase n=1 Tax=unclassified Saccharicrinis TaxID=2646859 RepID=UPI003D34FCAE
MNVILPHIPERPEKNREYGLTMMMDKGLSLKESENFVSSSARYTDMVKFGFGTSVITNNLEEKLAVYRDGNCKTYFGGTLFEAFIARGMFDEYCRYLDKFKMEYAEVSDGTLPIPHDEKLEYIRKLSEQVTVLSEVGSKMGDKVITNKEWVYMMETELQAGSWKVIAEARESGNIGIYNIDGSANTELIEQIKSKVDTKNVLWEAPQKSQQVWFIDHFGPNVNLGNIDPNEVVPLETLRLGLRGDTLLSFLPKK